jgi:hypothetical protein
MKSENKDEKCCICGVDYTRFILINTKKKKINYYCSKICLKKDLE